MIELLPDMPEGVTGIRVSGRIRGDDLREFKPAMDEMLKSGEMQGYLFSPGVNTVRIEQFLREKKSLPAAYN